MIESNHRPFLIRELGFSSDSFVMCRISDYLVPASLGISTWWVRERRAAAGRLQGAILTCSSSASTESSRE
jgi:hypothetical protein